MSESSPDHVNDSSNEAQPEFYYTVLNLPTTATDHEIRDRYRQLSIIFHPDRQRDKQTEQTATKRFLEIQKAYEVLSDPVARKAYDLFGVEGVKLVSSDAGWESLSENNMKTELIRRKLEADELKFQRYIRSKGQLSLNLAAVPPESSEPMPWHVGLWQRARSLRPLGHSISHSVTVPWSDRTKFTLLGTTDAGGGDAPATLGNGIIGTVRHQYSPRLNFQGSASLISPRRSHLRAKYDDGDNQVDLRVFISPKLFNAFYIVGHAPMRIVPPIVTTASRRLFPGKDLWARFTVSTLPLWPQFQLELANTQHFDVLNDDMEDSPVGGSKSGLRPPSPTGLTSGVAFWGAGVVLNGMLFSMQGHGGLHFAELGLRAKVGANLGLMAWKFTVGASWHGTSPESDNSVGVDAGIGNDGIVLSLDATYHNQRFFLPIVLASEYDDLTAFWTAVVPATAFVLTYHFVLKPLRRRARIQYFNQARRELREAKSDVVRQAEETKLLLKDTAQRHMNAEASVDGLIITDALYGPSGGDDALQGLTVDVTVPLQALVSKSQLYIPGRRSKAGLPGFYDPVPSAAKTLRVRYTFRGRAHYAEIPDFMPVVLPLEEHCVE